MIDLKEANRSTIYLLPIIGGKVTYKKIQEYYVNTYLHGIDGFEILEYPLFLILNYEDSGNYDHVEQLLTQSPCYIGNRDLNEKQIVYAFNMPEEHYTKFLKGQYSQFQPHYKEMILTFYDLNFHHPENLLLLILRRDNALRHLHMKELGCTRASDGRGCKCSIDTYPEQVKSHGISSVIYHVDECPTYTKCKYYRMPVKDAISKDAELDDIPDFDKETYETGN